MLTRTTTNWTDNNEQNQELLREANTTGSKANDARMLHEVILIKEELERIREQVENLE